MHTTWKRMFLWSSVGGIALGATVALARKSRKPAPASLMLEKIPRKCKRISIQTERFAVEIVGKRAVACDKYVLLATPFRVWNVLDLPVSKNTGHDGGAPIFHVTVIRDHEPRDDGGSSDNNEIREKFYGTVSVSDSRLRTSSANHIARGATLELRKCYVGGAKNGVETGELHRSSGPILNYRFEYSDPDPLP